MSCNANSGLAGIRGPAGLAFELFQMISIWRWSKSRDHVVQFFLMVELFEEHASINTPEAQEKYGPFKERVKGYREDLLSMRTIVGEEEALRIAKSARGQMKSVLKNIELSPGSDHKICRHWQRAAEAKTRYRRIPAPVTPMTPTGAGLPICLDINISLASQDLQPRETRKLAFSKLMENWYLSPLLTYSLAHPGKESTSQEPLKRQAMDAIYLRSVDEGRRVWVPLDFWHKMTVRECVARIKSCPDTEIRFISCKFRFVLVTLNDKASNKAVERIIDLKKDGKILLKVLKGRKMRQSAPTLDVKDKDKTGKDGARQYHELATDPTALPITFAAAGAAVRMRVDSAGRAKKFDTKDALRELEPRTWLELYGPDLFATYSAQKVNLLIKFFSRFK